MRGERRSSIWYPRYIGDCIGDCKATAVEAGVWNERVTTGGGDLIN